MLWICDFRAAKNLPSTPPLLIRITCDSCEVLFLTDFQGAGTPEK